MPDDQEPTGKGDREVVLLCGPPGAGKTTAARGSRMTVYDLDDEQWASEKQFTQALEALGQQADAHAVVIRAAATSSARAKWSRLTDATHVYLVSATQPECVRRAKARGREDLRATLAAIPQWFAQHERNDDVLDFPGWKEHRMRNPGNRYGAQHAARRRQWAPRVANGSVTCWRCGKVIRPGTPWDLGHADGSDTLYNGPEHRACNRGAAGKLTNARRRSRALPTSEAW